VELGRTGGLWELLSALTQHMVGCEAPTSVCVNDQGRQLEPPPERGVQEARGDRVVQDGAQVLALGGLHVFDVAAWNKGSPS